jgi:hypothetical protein
MKPEQLLEIVGKQIGKLEAEIYNAINKRDLDIADVDLRVVDLAAAVELIDPEPLEGPPGEEGPPGPPGPRGADGVSLAFLGKWSDELEYRRGDVVAWDGASWGCCQATAAGDEPGTCEQWEVMALRGNRGRPGEPGPRGERGPAGECGPPGARILSCSIDEAHRLVFADEDGELAFVDLQPVMEAIAATVEAELDRRLEAIEAALIRAKML